MLSSRAELGQEKLGDLCGNNRDAGWPILSDPRMAFLQTFILII